MAARKNLAMMVIACAITISASACSKGGGSSTAPSASTPAVGTVSIAASGLSAGGKDMLTRYAARYGFITHFEGAVRVYNQDFSSARYDAGVVLMKKVTGGSLDFVSWDHPEGAQITLTREYPIEGLEDGSCGIGNTLQLNDSRLVLTAFARLAVGKKPGVCMDLGWEDSALPHEWAHALALPHTPDSDPPSFMSANVSLKTAEAPDVLVEFGTWLHRQKTGLQIVP